MRAIYLSFVGACLLACSTPQADLPSVSPTRVVIDDVGPDRTIEGFAVSADGLYLVTRDSRALDGFSNGALLALDFDGNQRWAFDLESNGEGVAAGDDRVYATTADGRLIALDASGNQVWEEQIQENLFEAPAANDQGFVALYASSEVRLYSRSGELVSRREERDAAIGNAFLRASAGQDGPMTAVLFSASIGTTVVGWQGAEMEQAWSHIIGLRGAVSHPGLRTDGGLFVLEGQRLVSATRFERTGDFYLVAVDASAGEVWEAELPGRVESAPVEGSNGWAYVLTTGRSEGEICLLVGIDGGGERRFTRDLMQDYLNANPDIVSTSHNCSNSQPLIAFDHVWTDTPDGLAAYDLTGEKAIPIGTPKIRTLAERNGRLWAASPAALYEIDVSVLPLTP